jgi:hypothetical protein
MVVRITGVGRAIKFQSHLLEKLLLPMRRERQKRVIQDGITHPEVRMVASLKLVPLPLDVALRGRLACQLLQATNDFGWRIQIP